MMTFNNTFFGKTILVTGHAGFKGSWLSLWLSQLGATVVGYSLIPDGDHSLYELLNMREILADSKIADIRDQDSLMMFFQKHQPDIVFHMAAQPLVRLSYEEPLLTYESNVMGTLKVLEAARLTKSVKVFINVTTDKCYENIERAEGYHEEDRLGGLDIYSSSKACSELLTTSYRHSFLRDGHSYLLASVRAGNVIGGGDWAKDRLVPDCVRSLSQKETISIRNPHATRPWQHVLEPIKGYMMLAERLWRQQESGELLVPSHAYNFGPEEGSHLSVGTIVQYIIEQWGAGHAESGSDGGLHEAKLLQLNIERAKEELNFNPVWDCKQAIDKAIAWYKHFYTDGKNILDFTLNQIKEYSETSAL